MLDQNDIQQIKEIVQGTENKLLGVIQESEKRIVSSVISAVGEMVEQQILPQFDRLDQEIDRLKKDIARIESQMVTKEYLDKKLADEFSDFYNRLKREWFNKDTQWKQRVMGILQNAHIASQDDIRDLESLIGI